jgi:hypothetical protein
MASRSMFAFVLASFLLCLMAQSEEPDDTDVVVECDLECQNGGECNFGLGTCSCQEGYSGDYCEIKFDGCTLECQGGGYCSTREVWIGDDMNGDPMEGEGDGMNGDDDSGEYVVVQFCTCQEGYSGDYCEVKADCGTFRCLNGGVCTSDEVSVQGGHNRVLDRKLDQDEEEEFWDDDDDDHNDCCFCYCPDGYYGSDCQFETCTLPCQNDGYCFTKEEWINDNSGEYEVVQFCTCQEGYSGDYCEVKADCGTFRCLNGGVCTSDEVSVQGGHDRVLQDWDGRDYYCGCKEGFFGDFCERKECGSGFCANGAACLLLPSGGGDYVCDCSAGFFNDIYAAGRHCESIAYDICDFGQENPNEPWICTNFGQCILTTSGTECSCTGGYEGPRCEYSALIAEDLEWGICGLQCQNEGKCLKGAVKPLADIFFPFLEATKSSELFSYAPTDDFEYCYCPPGFFGVQCEEQYELCDGGEHICFHGSTCQNGTGDQWECDCSEALAAGLYCQYEATDICDDQDVTKFCTNDGTCSSATDTM